MTNELLTIISCIWLRTLREQSGSARSHFLIILASECVTVCRHLVHYILFIIQLQRWRCSTSTVSSA